jgi:hypothetical protein
MSRENLPARRMVEVEKKGGCPGMPSFRERRPRDNLLAISLSEIAAQVGKAVVTWRDEATKHSIKKTQIDRMASAFEYKDLQQAPRGQ